MLIRTESTGLVLAGGASSRLGRDKAREAVAGKVLLVHAVEAVTAVCSEVLIAGERAGREDLDLPSGARWVPDIHPGRGPLAGLHAGLAAARYDITLAVGCDMPFLNPLLLASLVRLAPGHEAVVPRVGGSLQTLHAVYTHACLAHAEALLAEPGRLASLQDLIGLLRVRYVDEGEMRLLDPDLRSTFSVNTKEDLAQAQRLLGATARVD